MNETPVSVAPASRRRFSAPLSADWKRRAFTHRSVNVASAWCSRSDKIP